MINLPLLATLASTISAIAIPQKICTEPTTGGVSLPWPTEINVKYFQAAALSPDDACGMEVASGTLEAEQCKRLCTVSISIAQAPNNNCTFTVFTGTDSCDDGAAEKISYPIPAGTESVCVNIGVRDGCDFQFASGVWSCG